MSDSNTTTGVFTYSGDGELAYQGDQQIARSAGIALAPAIKMTSEERLDALLDEWWDKPFEVSITRTENEDGSHSITSALPDGGDLRGPAAVVLTIITSEGGHE